MLAWCLKLNLRQTSTKMLNKLQFNNLVITNKKQIQQIKVQTIQKIVQKIRKLKCLLEKRPDDEKTKSRLRKTTESMEQLKKLKRVDIVKRILLLEKSAAAVITNGLATPEELAVAMMALHKNMQSLVQSFKEKLGLKPGDETWKRELLRMSKRRFKIMRTEQKRQTRQQLKEQKVLARKRVEWLKGNNSTEAVPMDRTADNYESEATKECDANISTTGIWKVEVIKPKISNEGRTNQAKMKTETKQKIKKVLSKQQKQTAISTVKTEERKSLHGAIEPLHIEQLDNVNGVAAHNNNLLGSEVTDPDPTNSAIDDITHVVDPFFITGSGENYRSTAVIIRDTDPQAPQQQAKSRSANGMGIAPQKRQCRTTDRTYKRNERSQEHPTKWRKAEEKLVSNGVHPSWAAKQKFKPIITGFQGKKITFGDAEVSVERNKSVKITEHTSVDKKSKTNTNEMPLHPSWAAKQKLKSNIIAFQGKKVVFNDATTSSGPKTANKPPQAAGSASADLHPSWAAKQKLKPVINAFQGKKITFDN